jgi:hypothetical protein
LLEEDIVASLWEQNRLTIDITNLKSCTIMIPKASGKQLQFMPP